MKTNIKLQHKITGNDVKNSAPSVRPFKDKSLTANDPVISTKYIPKPPKNMLNDIIKIKKVRNTSRWRITVACRVIGFIVFERHKNEYRLEGMQNKYIMTFDSIDKAKHHVMNETLIGM